MNAYHRRQAAERERRVAEAARRTRERRDGAIIHADAVVRAYHDAYALVYPEAPLPEITYVADTGKYYHIRNNKREQLLEKHLTAATEFMYATAHEKEIDPDSV